MPTKSDCASVNCWASTARPISSSRSRTRPVPAKASGLSDLQPLESAALSEERWRGSPQARSPARGGRSRRPRVAGLHGIAAQRRVKVFVEKGFERYFGSDVAVWARTLTVPRMRSAGGDHASSGSLRARRNVRRPTPAAFDDRLPFGEDTNIVASETATRSCSSPGW